MLVGERIRYFRLKRKLSKVELATAAGLAASYITLLELDKKSPTIRSLGKILECLEVTPSEFFTGVWDQMDRGSALIQIKYQLKRMAIGDIICIEMLVERIRGAQKGSVLNKNE